MSVHIEISTHATELAQTCLELSCANVGAELLGIPPLKEGASQQRASQVTMIST
jgi:hypothetical protein